MIHATFADGTTMLFQPDEQVWVCDEVLSGYIAGERSGCASQVIQPGVHVLDRVTEDGATGSETKIIGVRNL